MTIGTWKPVLAGALFAVAVGRIASGQAGPQDDPYASQDDTSIQQTVARLSYISGDVAFARGDDPDNWQPADPNTPMTIGDRVWTADGRLELEVHGGDVVRLAKQTDLAALNLTDDTKQFSLSSGVASFNVRRFYENEVFEVDTPNGAVTFESPGDYRIDVLPNGNTRVQVRRGRASVAAGGGQIGIDGGEALMIGGDQPPRYDFTAMPFPDGWDGWVHDREARFQNVRSYQYVSPDIAGVQDLDTYGTWQNVPSYGWCWTPASVAVGWAPYRDGRWMWQDPWGWTWVSNERWGWAPYHYGRWVNSGPRWYWVPVAPTVAVVSYNPAIVGFVGGGPGFAVTAGFSTGYVGWFPLAPREPFIPWWGRPAVQVNVTNVTYVNRTYVTVVNQQTFVQGGIVNTNTVSDASVMQRMARAPVVAGIIPVVPTRESIRVSTRTVAAARPPAAVASRTVVARVAPPPAPPRFDEKVQVIRERKGAPIDAAAAQKIAVERGPARASVPVRPAAPEPGRVQLAPRDVNAQSAKSRQAQPISAAPAGRTLATSERPVATQAPGVAQARGRQVQAPPQNEAPARPATNAREAPAQPAQREAAPPPAQRDAQTIRPTPQGETASQHNVPPPRVTASERSAPAASQPEREKRPHPTPYRHPTARPEVEDHDHSAHERSVAPPPAERAQPRNQAVPPEHSSNERAEHPTPRPGQAQDRSHPRPTPKPD